jgi:prepilin-type N-terminal cleavage/methylation domain-containing protein
MQPTNSRQPKTEKAFTLIELLVVIAIVGILAGLAVVNMSGATEAARIAKLKVYSNSIRSSLMGNRVSEWLLDEGAGTTTTDTIGLSNGVLNNFNFDLTDGWRSGSSCVSGGCLQFDGTDDYVDCGNSSSLDIANAITIEAWVKTSTTQSNKGIVERGTVGVGSSYDYMMYFHTDTIYFFMHDSAGTEDFVSTAFDFHDDKWHHYVMLFDGDYMRVYVDGKKIGSKDTVLTNIRTGTGTLHFGRYATSYFNGLIDGSRIYNAALTASAISDQYVAGIDKLLANNQITSQDYQQRLADLNSTYATNK